MDERKPSIYTDNTASNDVVGTSKELDKYGVWVKSAPQVLPVADSENQESLITFTLDDDKDALTGDSLQDTVEAPPLDSDDAVKPVADASKNGSLFDPLSSLDDLDTVFEHPPDTIGTIADDLLVSKNQDVPPLVQEDFAQDLTAPDGSSGAGSSPSTDCDAPAINTEVPTGPNRLQIQDDPPVLQSLASDTVVQLLTKIVDELSLIRDELSSVKNAVIHTEASQEKQGTPKAVDFLDEGEEEKITLTGKELNNILNAPDFTEELKAEILKDIEAELSDKDLSLDELDFLMQDPYGSQPFSSDDTSDLAVPSLDTLEDSILLEDPEEFQRLMKEGDKPIAEAPNESRGIDDLLIEHGSMKDIPIELDLEDDLLDDARDETIPLDSGADPVLPDLMETQERFDITDLLDQQSPVSDEELDTLEKNILQEFSEFDTDVPPQDDFMLEYGGLPEKKDVPVSSTGTEVSFNLREGLKTVLSYMDQLLESLPDDKIKEFIESEHFATYKKLLNELGLA